MLKIIPSELNNLELICELKNISNDTIEIDHFCVNSNGFRIEKPDGKPSEIGIISYGSKQKHINVYPDSTMTWVIELDSRYFDTSRWGIRPKENGTYKFYWVVNGIKSEPFIYEYAREKE